MRTLHVLTAVAVCLFTVLTTTVFQIHAADETNTADYKLLGPFQHRNLKVFLVTGEETYRKDLKIVPLSTALDKGIIQINETGTVSQLTARNRSRDVAVYMQSGDMLRGGRQDRVVTHDHIVHAGTEIPISTFCIERGRWSQRGFR